METIQTTIKKETPSKESTLAQLAPRSCFRCGGFLMTIFCVSPDDGSSEFQISVWKCLQCGDLFDKTILENRSRSQQTQLIPN